MATTDQQQHEEELVDYDEEDQDQTAEKDVAADGAQKRGNYVAIHSSGFRDFFLKAELLRAIGDAGFEHPSEGLLSTILRSLRPPTLENLKTSSLAFS